MLCTSIDGQLATAVAAVAATGVSPCVIKQQSHPFVVKSYHLSSTVELVLVPFFLFPNKTMGVFIISVCGLGVFQQPQQQRTKVVLDMSVNHDMRR